MLRSSTHTSAKPPIIIHKIHSKLPFVLPWFVNLAGGRSASTRMWARLSDSFVMPSPPFFLLLPRYYDVALLHSHFACLFRMCRHLLSTPYNLHDSSRSCYPSRSYPPWHVIIVQLIAHTYLYFSATNSMHSIMIGKLQLIAEVRILMNTKGARRYKRYRRRNADKRTTKWYVTYSSY